MLWDVGTRKRLAMMLAVALAVTSVSAVSLAAPTAAEKETARGLVRSGRAKKKKGELDAAIEDFAAAHAIMNVPTTGTELGKAQLDAGMLVEALDTLLGVVRLPKARFEPRAFRRARKEAEKLAKDLPPRIPAVVIELEGEGADGASVTVDGKEQRAELLGAPIKLNPGTHEIVATSSDGVEDRDSVDLQEGMTREVSLRLEPPEAAPEPSGGDETGGDDTMINPVVWVGFGLAGAGVIVGSVTGALAMSKYGAVAPQCQNNQCPPETHGDLDSGKTMGTVSTVSFIVAGVGAAAGVVGLFFPLESGDADADDDADVALGFGPGFVTVRGRF